LNIYQQILTRYWGYSEFRPVQEDIIKSVAAGHDTLGLLPTGGGKSVTFQVPTLAGDGMCLVVTPLIALMIVLGWNPTPVLERMEPSVRAVIERVESANAQAAALDDTATDFAGGPELDLIDAADEGDPLLARPRSGSGRCPRWVDRPER